MGHEKNRCPTLSGCASLHPGSFISSTNAVALWRAGTTVTRCANLFTARRVSISAHRLNFGELWNIVRAGPLFPDPSTSSGHA